WAQSASVRLNLMAANRNPKPITRLKSRLSHPKRSIARDASAVHQSNERYGTKWPAIAMGSSLLLNSRKEGSEISRNGAAAQATGACLAQAEQSSSHA